MMSYYTGQHQFSLWNNIDSFILEVGLQTPMYQENVYIILRLDDTCWHLSVMAKTRNLGLYQTFLAVLSFLLL